MDFNKKRNRDFFDKKALFKTVGIVFLAVILILIIVDFKIYKKKQQLNAQIDNYQKQIEDIKKSSQTLKNEIANSDSIDYLEKLGYEQFNQTRPGETEYMFVKSQKNAEAGPGGYQKSVNFWDIKSWWGQLVGGLNWIKSKF